jgi:Zn-dependent peptidase ImmA (M78 family)/transcriptional regulator with XRE-family HTH domain
VSKADVLPVNLRRYRSAQGLSQQAVAEKAGLSRVGYRDIESGKATPRLDSLQRISEALGVAVPDLLVPVRDLRHVRFRAQKRMVSRENILADVARWLDDYLELEELLDAKARWSLEDVAKQMRRCRKRGVELGKLAAEQARCALGLSNDDHEDSIRDMCGLLEDHGVKVLTASVASEGFFGLSVGPTDGGPAVFVNVWDRISVERWIFTAAHELGHLLLHPEAYDVEETDEPEEEEKEADAFAGYFLMPDRVFQNEWAGAWGLGLVERVFKLKRIFKVSWQTVLYRVAASLPKAERAKTWAQFHAVYKQQYGQYLTRGSEPQALDPKEFNGRPADRVADEPRRLLDDDFREDRLSRLVRSAVEEEKITLSRAAEILGLDLMDMRMLASSWFG